MNKTAWILNDSGRVTPARVLAYYTPAICNRRFALALTKADPGVPRLTHLHSGKALGRGEMFGEQLDGVPAHILARRILAELVERVGPHAVADTLTQAERGRPIESPRTEAQRQMVEGFLTTAADLARPDGTGPFPRIPRAARRKAAAHVQRLIDTVGWPALEAVAGSPAYATRHPDYPTAWHGIGSDLALDASAAGAGFSDRGAEHLSDIIRADWRAYHTEPHAWRGWLYL